MLATLEKNELCKAAQMLHYVRYNKFESIFHQGAPVIGWYLLCRGWAKLIFSTSQGKRVLLKFCRSGNILGGVACEVHVVSAVAMSEAVTCLIPPDVAGALVRQHPEITLETSRRLARDRHMLLGRLAYLPYGSVRERLAKGLLELGDCYGVHCEQGLLIDIPLTQRDLADLIGTSRQKVNLNLRKFVDQGLIRTKRGRIIILDQQGLQELG